MLSSNVRVVLSMINQKAIIALSPRDPIRPSKCSAPAVRSIYRREGYVYVDAFFPPLFISYPKAIITETFARYNKRLDDSQMRLLLSKDGSANPLWLSLACEELRKLREGYRQNSRVGRRSSQVRTNELKEKSRTQNSASLRSLLQQILSRLEEEENGGHLVRIVGVARRRGRHFAAVKVQSGGDTEKKVYSFKVRRENVTYCM